MKTQITSKGLLDIRTISLLGLSAKQDASAIGQFGTGMKYAIAVLLRTGHQIGLKIGETTYEFKTKAETFRDKDFTQIIMSGPDGETVLPITLEYGKNWKVWMAFRELWSNALDEGLSQQGQNTTTWTVEGQEFADCYAKRTIYFIPEKGKLHGDTHQIHVQDGATDAIYCKTVRAATFPSKFTKTYNVDVMPLTEEREASSDFIAYHITRYLFSYIEDTLDFSIFQPNSMETKFDWAWVGEKRVRPLAKEILKAGRKNIHIPNSLINMALKCLPLADRAVKIKLNKIEQTQLDRAIELLTAAGLEIEEMNFVETLPDEAYGMVFDGDIYIAKSAFTQGTAFLAGTIYEEHLHHQRGMWDESRRLQNHLINELMAAWQHQHGIVL